MTEHSPPPQAVILQMLMGPWIAQALGAVAKLNVADQLSDGPKRAADIASAVGAHADHLDRTLRALSTVGIFADAGEGRWALTPLGEVLRSAAPGSMRDMVAAETDHAHWATWGLFTESVRSGGAQAKAALGCEPWEYYAKKPEDGATFSRAMANISGMAIEPVLASYDFSGAEVIADIGGAYGALLAAILRKHAGPRGVLFDLPHIVQGADAVLGDVGSRVERVGGSFLENSVPAADIYLLKHILHDWDDAASLKILQNVRKAMKPDARVLVIEMVVPEPTEPGPAVLMDLNMMVMLNGMERTSGQYGALFSQAGLKPIRTLPTPSPYSIVEAGAA